MPATLPTKQALTEAREMLQQHDYETSNGDFETPLAESNHRRHILALEAKLDAMDAGTSTPAQRRAFAKWLKGWVDDGFDPEGYWPNAYAWACGKVA